MNLQASLITKKMSLFWIAANQGEETSCSLFLALSSTAGAHAREAPPGPKFDARIRFRKTDSVPQPEADNYRGCRVHCMERKDG